jgi:hypothetical protein
MTMRRNVEMRHNEIKLMNAVPKYKKKMANTK